LKKKKKSTPSKPTGKGVWISPNIFEVDLKPEGWPDDPDLRSGVDWLLTFVKPEDWKRRRFTALQHFVDSVAGSSHDPTGKGRFFDERDQFAWYLFLGQAFLDHPTIYDFMYGSRVVPVLTEIGRDLELLKGVRGIEARVRRMVGPEKSQPNSCLFELLVAAAYRRAGAAVAFLEEQPGVAKTYDMDVSLHGTNWAVECKRLEGGEYTEGERTRARELWLPVAHAFHTRGLNVLCTTDFLVELSAVPNDYLARKAREWFAAGALLPLSWGDGVSIGRLERLNLGPLQRILATDDVAMNSSRMHELLTGRYKQNAHIISSLLVKFADNPVYVDQCDAGCVFDWESRSDAAIDKKARDIFKRLADGCAQLPRDRPGIVHIGFEAVDGLDVEAVRHEKVMMSVGQFDPGDKPLEYVYVHWLAPESPPNTAMAFDETCHWQAVRPTRPRPLESGLLMLPPDVQSRDGVHWHPLAQ
jgi:hypothetical protein